jgi:protein-tyrosine phosphatase
MNRVQPTIYEIASIGAGKLSVMAMPASGESIEEEFAGLRVLGISHVVSLLEDDEQKDVGLNDEELLCERNGMRFTSFPIIDRDVPQKADGLALTSALHQDIEDGEHVVIHCRAGIGRTGLIASAVLVSAGHSPDEAIHMVSFARGVLIPETDEQDRWVRSLR